MNNKCSLYLQSNKFRYPRRWPSAHGTLVSSLIIINYNKFVFSPFLMLQTLLGYSNSFETVVDAA